MSDQTIPQTREEAYAKIQRVIDHFEDRRASADALAKALHREDDRRHWERELEYSAALLDDLRGALAILESFE